MYKLTILTELNNTLTLTAPTIQELIACGNDHSTCQSYEITDIDTGELEFYHCNLPAAFKKQAS